MLDSEEGRHQVMQGKRENEAQRWGDRTMPLVWYCARAWGYKDVSERTLS